MNAASIWILGAVGGVALFVASALVVRWMLGRKHGVVSTGSRTGRTARVGALGSKMSLRYTWAKLRGLFAPAETRAAIVQRAHLESAEEVVALMGNMKGGMMKLGQILSFVGDDLPEEYRNVLASLQTQSPPMAFGLARDIVEKDLGHPLKKLYRAIDEEPLAAASIGQVHRARLAKGGGDVVVKVQYPGIAEAIDADLANVAFLYSAMGMISPNLDSGALADELKERITEELDYGKEAANQKAFAEAYEGHPYIHVPKVIESHSGRRVLTSEHVDAHDFAWLRSQPKELRDRVGEVLWRFVFGSITQLHVFNADPHPGNYLFHPDGKVTFLDYGCVRYFDPDRMPKWKALIRAHLESDMDAFRRLIVELGFVVPDSKIPTELWYEYFGYFYEPFWKDEPFTFTSEYTKKSLAMVFDRSHPRYGALTKEANMPKDFLLVNRIQWGLYSILASLGCTANWHRIHRELYYGDAPSTPIGRECAEFAQRWRQTRGIDPRVAVHLAPGGVRIAQAA